jgi:hypothetical protein
MDPWPKDLLVMPHVYHPEIAHSLEYFLEEIIYKSGMLASRVCTGGYGL